MNKYGNNSRSIPHRPGARRVLVPPRMARMLLPAARPLLLTGFFRAFLFSWFDCGMTLVIGAGKPPTPTLKIFEYAAAAAFHPAGACATLLILPPLAVLPSTAGSFRMGGCEAPLGGHGWNLFQFAFK